MMIRTKSFKDENEKIQLSRTTKTKQRPAGRARQTQNEDRRSKRETEAGRDRIIRTDTDKSKKVLKETDRDRQ